MTTGDRRPEDVHRALAVLELPPEATATEVRQAYRFLRDLYGGESIATLPISSEMSTEEREAIIEEIEAAYKTMSGFFEAERHKAQHGAGNLPADVKQLLSETECLTGAVLRSVREMHGYTLKEVAADTRIPIQQLKNIEGEDFKNLPPPVYTRGFLAGYAGFLEIDASRAAEDFMGRFDRWRKQNTGTPSRKRFRLAFWKKK